jgi:hypothetical protein
MPYSVPKNRKITRLLFDAVVAVAWHHLSIAGPDTGL